MRSLLCLILGLFALSLTGCAPLAPVRNPIPPEVTINSVASGVLADAPLAVSADGAFLALVRKDGLRLRNLADGAERLLSPQHPEALAFSGDSQRLASAVNKGTETELRLMDVTNGAILAQISVKGRCSRLFWRAPELLAMVTVVTPYKFGINLSLRLVRWDGRSPLRLDILHEITLRPDFQKWGDRLSTLAHPVLSPQGDELLYRRLQDPPRFSPYFTLVQRHLESGAEQVLAKVALNAGDVAYLAGGDEILFGDGTGKTQRVDPWSKAAPVILDTPGQVLAVSPGGRYLWLDRQLLRDDEPLLTFADTVQPVDFLPSGRLLVRAGESLWLLSGLEEEAVALDPARRERLLLLRSWRATDLISQEDYLQQRKDLP